MIRYIAALLDARFRIGQKVFLEYIKGHAGFEGNEGADGLANVGATMEEAEERDWDELKDSYMAKVEELIEARKLRLAQKKTSLEVVGAEAATEDWEKEALETESGLDAQSPKNNKVRRVDEAPDASARGKLPVVPDRRYSAGVAQPSAEVCFCLHLGRTFAHFHAGS